MNEVLQTEGPFRHVSMCDLVGPLMILFYSVTRAGEENSVVLHEQAQAKRTLVAAQLFDAEEPIIEEFRAACREASIFADQIVTGQIAACSADLLALAKRASEQCATRQNEDIQAWADRLARDIGHATD